MKQIKEFITEKFKVSSKNITKYNYHPKDKDELIYLIDKLIKERGKNADLNDIDTSKITDMSSLFADSDFNGDISQWDVSNVENMNWMFTDSDFKGDISSWEVNKHTYKGYMFDGCPLEKNKPSWY